MGWVGPLFSVMECSTSKVHSTSLSPVLNVLWQHVSNRASRSACPDFMQLLRAARQVIQVGYYPCLQRFRTSRCDTRAGEGLFVICLVVFHSFVCADCRRVCGVGVGP